jgi:hypothetical protein
MNATRRGVHESATSSLACFGVAASLFWFAAGASATTSISVNLQVGEPYRGPSIVFRHEPEIVVVPETRVYYVRNCDYDLYRYGSYWYYCYDGGWCAARAVHVHRPSLGSEGRLHGPGQVSPALAGVPGTRPCVRAREAGAEGVGRTAAKRAAMRAGMRTGMPRVTSPRTSGTKRSTEESSAAIRASDSRARRRREWSRRR